jgi:hypothetical protein
MFHAAHRLAGALILARLPTAALSAPPPIPPPAEALAVALTLRADCPGPVVNRNIYGHLADEYHRLLGAEPHVSANVGSGSVLELG